MKRNSSPLFKQTRATPLVHPCGENGCPPPVQPEKLKLRMGKVPVLALTSSMARGIFFSKFLKAPPRAAPHAEQFRVTHKATSRPTMGLLRITLELLFDSSKSFTKKTCGPEPRSNIHGGTAVQILHRENLWAEPRKTYTAVKLGRLFVSPNT